MERLTSVNPLEVGVGLHLFPGTAGEGKSVFVQNTIFRRSSMLSNFKYSDHSHLQTRLGLLALTIPSFTKMLLGVEVPARVKSETASSADIRLNKAKRVEQVGALVAEAIDSRKYSHIRTAVFTEADEQGSKADIIIDTFGISFSSPVAYTAQMGEDEIEVENVVAAIMLASVLQPVTISSMTPSLMFYSSLPNQTVKGGMNAAFIDSCNVFSKDLIKIGGSVIAEVRDDWDDSDSNKKLRGAGRFYAIINNYTLNDIRVRNVPGIFETEKSADLANNAIAAFKSLMEANPHVGKGSASFVSSPNFTFGAAVSNESESIDKIVDDANTWRK